ncbi:TIGR04283 family arsenosugar biosynthesis glycosyltransferase [Hyphococcus sp. DH-69]|uniref:TIGR04283 family arsenosugar biosynthesis glycosyltransferase n=1 Tax=Hyphococcus formosus TaxID=3143534 RepID=UPI00398A5B44
MISVVIPCLNGETRLPACLDALVGPAVEGLVREVIVVDGGSTDQSALIADGFGARVIETEPGRGTQLRAGAEAAKSDWLLFLHADTVLSDDWAKGAAIFMRGDQDRAAVFTLQFDRSGFAPNFVSGGAMLRTRLLKLPYGDQGLLISRRLYDAVGGFGDLPLMEDADFIRRLTKKYGRRAIEILPAQAITSAARYERDGYIKRVLKNSFTLLRYLLGASPEALKKNYD